MPKLLKRTVYCGELRLSDAGKEVVVCGWVQRQRDLGSIIFIDLRDRTGVCQLLFDENESKEIFDAAFSVRSEYVLASGHSSGAVLQKSQYPDRRRRNRRKGNGRL
jgi:aspartyl-tRNA synthetase